MKPIRLAMLYCGLYGFSAAFSQYFWIALDTAEGLWHLILTGTILVCVFFGAYYWILGMLFRLVYRFFPRWYVVIFPAIWVISEYCRTLGEISFPWSLLGYSFTPVLPLAQAASLGGVYLLSLYIVFTNCALWDLFSLLRNGSTIKRSAVFAVAAGVLLVAGLSYGLVRLNSTTNSGTATAKISCIQGNIDQNHWGNRSLDTSFTIAESLLTIAAAEKPDCIVFSESALLCYLVRKESYRERVIGWSHRFKTPMVIGALNWTRAPEGSAYRHFVYNTAFFLDSGAADFIPYYKMKLVPFSEAVPFEATFPILSRVNLGEADFKAGTEPVTYTINEQISGVPLICYEIIYPDFVRRRASGSTNLLINITNDGWFGRTNGPYQHAAMSQMRSIENGIAMVRCANSGISMLVDPVGRIMGTTGLYERRTLTATIPIFRKTTFYSRFGDWVVWLSLAICIIVPVSLIRRPKKD